MEPFTIFYENQTKISKFKIVSLIVEFFTYSEHDCRSEKLHVLDAVELEGGVCQHAAVHLLEPLEQKPRGDPLHDVAEDEGKEEQGQLDRQKQRQSGPNSQ